MRQASTAYLKINSQLALRTKKNSLSADVKRTFIKAGIVTNKGDLDSIKLRKGFETGVIDIEVSNT
jgi:hypothetical protein